MDTNKMRDISREQFEAEFVQEMCRRGGEGFRSTVLHSLSQKKPGGDYQHITESLAWWAWRASREAAQASTISPEVATLMQRIDDEKRGQALLAEAFVRESGRASISALQRHFKIAYGAACRLMDRLVADGVVSAIDSEGRRQVLPKVTP